MLCLLQFCAGLPGSRTGNPCGSRTMKTRTRHPPICLLGALVTLLAMTSSCGGVKVYDLTHRLKEEEAMTWPFNPKYNFSILHRGAYPEVGWEWFENNKFSMPEHMGTHMDAPAHYAKGKWRIHQIPPEKLMGPGVMIDVSHKVKDNPGYGMTVEDLKEWESTHRTIPEKAVVLVNFGWAARYPDKNRVFSSDNLKDSTTFRFPIVTGDAAKWLVNERNMLALGTDTPTPDLDMSAVVHLFLLGRNLLILENVANLNSMPATGTTVVMGGLNIWDGSGAPMRLLAFSGGWKPQGWSSVSLAVLSLTLSLTTRRLGL